MKRNLTLSSILAVCLLAASALALASEGTSPLQQPEGGSGLVARLDLTEGFVCESDEPGSREKESVAACKSGCNKKCSGASNKAKCVGTCRRACDA